MGGLTISNMRLSEITPYERNPRKNDSAVEAVVQSIEQFGWQQPIVVDAHRVIIIGHTRYKAAVKMGLEWVPVHVAKDLSPEQVKALRIADNKSGEIAEWDLDLLPLELSDLRTAEFDISTLGFSSSELAKILKGIDDPLGDKDLDEVPPEPENPITVDGDIWKMGTHRLLCGDATKPECYAALMGPDRADLLLCEKLGRSCRAIELSPSYCDVIVKRWEEVTGRKAERTTTAPRGSSPKRSKRQTQHA